MQIDRDQFVGDLETEIGDVNDAYEQDPRYPDGVLEGIRLVLVLVNEQLATAEKIRL
jgi:hypothetical protein